MIKTKIIKVAKDKQRSGTGFYNSPTYSNSSTNINVDSELSESSTNPVQNAVITNELNQIKADAVNTVSNTDNTLYISKSGNTVNINSKTWKFNENGDLIYDGTIIPNEVVTSILNADTATLETLTVTKAAHFFQLVIDEIKSTKGQILITAANAKLDKVEETTDNYKCYWKTTDGNKKIYNQFAVDDQVICQTFNTLLDGNTNLVNDSTFTDLSNWSASDTYKPLDNSKVTVEDGEVSFISENNTCYLAQRLNLSPNTEYTIKFDMKQDVASYSNVSFIFHSPIIDTTKPYFTNGDAFINNQTLNGIDGNIGTEYKTFYITFTTLPTLPSICNMEFVCTNAESENVTTYIRNVELVAASKNKYYWNKVISVGQSLIDGETYNYIEVSKTDKDSKSNSFPEVGDEIAQLGNRSDTDRQAAIIISAYNNQYLDNAIQAPSIVQYNGINNYNLSTHRLNVISKGYNSFSGNFTTTAGENLENKFMPYFPINAPFYLNDYTMEEPQATNPIRYNGSNDIYSTPTFLNAGKYKFRVFINSASLSSSIEIGSYGTTYPSSDLANYSGIGLTSVLGTTGKTMKVGSTTFYEYSATINITANGYYGLNYWENYQIYIPENDEGFETNSSKIEQTNTRITTTVNNINGQISTINQTAENIEAKVDNVSVKIDSGQITLNGNTKVQGDLTISDSTNGFTLTNDDKYNTIIKPQSIGEYEDYKSGKSSKSYYANGTNNVLTVENSKSNQSKPTNTEYFEVRYTCDNINKYNLVSGQTLHLTSYQDFHFIPNRFTAYNGYPYEYYFFNGQYTPSTTDFDSKIYLNGLYIERDFVLMSAHIYSISTRFSIINSTNTEVGYTVVNGLNPILNYTYTATTAGEYTIKAAVTVRLNTMQNNDVNKNNTRRRMDYVFRDYVMSQFTFTIVSTLNTNEIENKIGYDGISLSLGNNNIVYIGKDSTHIKYGNYDLMVDSDGIKKYAGLTAPTYQNEGDATDTAPSKYISEYAPINGCAVRELLRQGTYYLQPRDEVIIYKATDGGGDATFYLGDPTLSKNIGRKVYMKVYSNNHYIIVYGRSTTYYDIIQSARRNPLQKYEVDDRGVMFVSDGSKWLSYVSY